MPEALTVQGIYAPLPSPFDQEGHVDSDKLLSNLERWDSEPLSGYVVGGSNGEFTSLSGAERVGLVRLVAERGEKARTVIAGCGMPSTAATIELGQEMAAAGAAALLVITPSYFKSRMSHDALVAYYHAVADKVPLPVILYNMPANTGIDMSAETVLAAAQHPNIVGLKDSSGRVDKMGIVAHKTPGEFCVLAGSGGYMLGALAMGAVGVVAALANLAGRVLREIYDEFHAGDLQSARKKQLALIEINTAVTAGYGVAGLKAALDLLGYYGGPVRPPLIDLNHQERQNVERLLVEAGLL